MNYLKGDSSANDILYAGIFDIATFFGFFKRFLIQFIRYVLITIKVILFSTWVRHIVSSHSFMKMMLANI